MEAQSNGLELIGNSRAASDILEDALQNFDNIIENAQVADEFSFEVNGSSDGGSLEDGVRQIANLMEDIRVAIESTINDQQSEDGRDIFINSLTREVNNETINFYKLLFSIEEPIKVKRLLQEKNNLQLNVHVLNEQIELQNEKMVEIEMELQQVQERLHGSDDRMKEELMTKTKLETDNLRYLNELTNVKLLLNNMREMQRRQEEHKNEVIRVNNELKEENIRLKEHLEKRNKEEENKPSTAACTPDEGVVITDKQEAKLNNLKMPNPTMTSTPTSNNPHDNHHHVGELPNNKPPTGSSEPRGGLPPKFPINLMRNADDSVSCSSLSVPKKEQRRSRSVERLFGKRILPSTNGDVTRASPWKKHDDDDDVTQEDSMTSSTSSPKSPGGNKSTSTPNLAMNMIRPLQLTTSGGLKSAMKQKPPPGGTPSVQRRKLRFKKLFNFKLRRSHSSTLDDDNMSTTSSGSNFVRGGLRATTGGSSSWNKLNSQMMQPRIVDTSNFASWTADDVMQWMDDIGLGVYRENCRNWLQAGNSLLQADKHDIEKELGIRNYFHKKKLTCHITTLSGDDGDMLVSGAVKMNSLWLTRWLDDIGLPQYKDAFQEACVDGLLLHNLTVGDVNKLNVQNLFHLLSMRRGIEVLRSCDFDPTQLQRRPQSDPKDEKLELWTSHRVMDWLRTIDLAEYAPNLRGSGVHGAVMVKEPLFNGETLSALLHIPQNKTLLRRHLATKLMDLLPKESSDLKYARANSTAFHPLNVNIKYKIGRRSFASTFGRSSTRGSGGGHVTREFSANEFVCPIPSTKTSSLQSHRSELEKKMQLQKAREKRQQSSSGDGEEAITPSSFNESTTRELNDFSQQLTSLTMIAAERK